MKIRVIDAKNEKAPSLDELYDQLENRCYYLSDALMAYLGKSKKYYLVKTYRGQMALPLERKKITESHKHTYEYIAHGKIPPQLQVVLPSKTGKEQYLYLYIGTDPRNNGEWQIVSPREHFYVEVDYEDEEDKSRNQKPIDNLSTSPDYTQNEVTTRSKTKKIHYYSMARSFSIPQNILLFTKEQFIKQTLSENPEFEILVNPNNWRLYVSSTIPSGKGYAYLSFTRFQDSPLAQKILSTAPATIDELLQAILPGVPVEKLQSITLDYDDEENKRVHGRFEVIFDRKVVKGKISYREDKNTVTYSAVPFVEGLYRITVPINSTIKDVLSHRHVYDVEDIEGVEVKPIVELPQGAFQNWDKLYSLTRPYAIMYRYYCKEPRQALSVIVSVKKKEYHMEIEHISFEKDHTVEKIVYNGEFIPLKVRSFEDIANFLTLL